VRKYPLKLKYVVFVILMVAVRDKPPTPPNKSGDLSPDNPQNLAIYFYKLLGKKKERKPKHGYFLL